MDPLRVKTHLYVPWESPYSCEGTDGPWREEDLRRAFATARTIEVGDPEDLRMPHSHFFTVQSGIGSPILGTSGGIGSQFGAYAEFLPPLTREVATLKVTKVGVLYRKDDTIEGGKRASNRKWKEWTVILTGSQLLFFRDTTLAAGFLSRAEGVETEVPIAPLRPEELLSVQNAIAVIDHSYTKVCLILSSH